VMRDDGGGEATTAPARTGAGAGAVTCLPTAGTVRSAERSGQSKSPAGIVLSDHSTWRLLLPAIDLRFGARARSVIVA
jgi:hypothetical protein